MAEDRDEFEGFPDYGERIRNAVRTDRRTFGVIFIFMVAALYSSSWMVTTTGLDSRFQQLGVAIALAVFWTAYYALSIHPKVLGNAIEDER